MIDGHWWSVERVRVQRVGSRMESGKTGAKWRTTLAVCSGMGMEELLVGRMVARRVVPVDGAAVVQNRTGPAHSPDRSDRHGRRRTSPRCPAFLSEETW